MIAPVGRPVVVREVEPLEAGIEAWRRSRTTPWPTRPIDQGHRHGHGRLARRRRRTAPATKGGSAPGRPSPPRVDQPLHQERDRQVQEAPGHRQARSPARPAAGTARGIRPIVPRSRSGSQRRLNDPPVPPRHPLVPLHTFPYPNSRTRPEKEKSNLLDGTNWWRADRPEWSGTTIPGMNSLRDAARTVRSSRPQVLMLRKKLEQSPAPCTLSAAEGIVGSRGDR